MRTSTRPAGATSPQNAAGRASGSPSRLALRSWRKRSRSNEDSTAFGAGWQIQGHYLRSRQPERFARDLVRYVARAAPRWQVDSAQRPGRLASLSVGIRSRPWLRLVDLRDRFTQRLLHRSYDFAAHRGRLAQRRSFVGYGNFDEDVPLSKGTLAIDDTYARTGVPQ